jgi:hypothetical protein
MKTTMKTLAAACVAVATFSISGCDVVNPGPVQDEFLAEDASQPGLVNGAWRRLAETLSYGNYTMAVLSREVFPGGQIGAFGHDVDVQGGHVRPGDDVGRWNDTQQARFIAETAIKRFTAVDADDDMMYLAHLYAGFAYRTLGEWWCDAVLDSQDPADAAPGVYVQGTDSMFTRAVWNFTQALSYASSADEQAAARGGRASAYLWLKKYAEAAGDAATVPDDFEFNIKFDGLEQAYYNGIYWSNARKPYLSWSLNHTWHKEEYDRSGDPRLEWFTDPAFPFAVGSLSGYGQVPWSNQKKYSDQGDDQRIVSGWEMRLVQAEAILAQNGNHLTALELINKVRRRNISTSTSAALPDYTSASATETWKWLKQERGIELWLEGRRLGDERRWAKLATPGALYQPSVAWETLTPLFTANPRSYCLDIPDSERDSNPNVPASGT